MENTMLIKNARVFTPYETMYPGYVFVENGVIRTVGKGVPTHIPANTRVLDVEGMILGPGFVDTHIHGVLGYDTMDGGKESILGMSRTLARYGVTAFVPTTVSAPHEKLVEVVKANREASFDWSPRQGAIILGLHLEGPYINPIRAGAHNKKFIRKPSVKELEKLYEVSEGFIREITIAPELENVAELVEYAVARGITVQVGHTNATYEEALNAVLMGVSKATHLYNAMREIHHRDPGVIIALLQSPSVYLEIIVDFIHVAPQVVKFTIDYAGVDGVALITDAISATGLPDGIYELGGVKIEVKKVSRAWLKQGL